jgi:mannose-6-phosphate isomerase-like protein (cupin superfamily)
MMAKDTTKARVLGPLDGDIIGAEGLTDRLMIEAKDSGGGFALVEHRLGPRMLVAPLHRHTREDEYSYVLEGRVGALLGEEEVFAEAGDLIFKPRGQWHTFWNAGDVPARILEIIPPAGFEQLFRDLGAYEVPPDPKTLAEIGARYGGEIDFERTPPIVERHGLVF